MKVSFDEIGRVSATFRVESGEAGQVVMVTDSGTVAVGGDGEPFCGVLEGVRKGYGSVQVQGFVQLPYTGGDLSVGYKSLAGDGKGGVRSGSGKEYLVVSVDTAAKTCVIKL